MVSLGLSASPVLSHDLSYVTSFFVMFSVLRSEVDELITNSVSGSTLAVYEHNKQKYRQFCRDMVWRQQERSAASLWSSTWHNFAIRDWLIVQYNRIYLL